MLTTDDLRIHTGLNTAAWPILLEEADRYGYDDEKTKNIAWGFKLGYEWSVGRTDLSSGDSIAKEYTI